MFSLSVMVVLCVVAFLACAAFGSFALLVISIHRSARAQFSEIRSDRAGSFARRVLTGFYADGKESGE
jgi:hypothetical protein